MILSNKIFEAKGMKFMDQLFDISMFVSNDYLPESYKRIMTPHSHQSLEISYVSKGELILEYTSAKTGKMIREIIFPNQFFIIAPNCKHCTQIPHTLDSIGMELITKSGNVMGTIKQSEFFTSLPLALDILDKFEDVIILNDSHNFRYILNGFQKFVDAPKDKFTPYSFNIQLRRLAIEFLKCLQSSPKITNYNPHLKKALTYIDANCRTPITVNEVAEYLELSVGYTQQLFHKHLDCTVNDYINGERIRQAKILIENSNYPIAHIAASVGYSTIQNFIANFKKIIGMTPSQYKKETIKKNQEYHKEKNQTLLPLRKKQT